MTLRPIADDGDLLALDQGEIRVLVVVDLHVFPFGVVQRLGGRRSASVLTPAVPQTFDSLAAADTGTPVRTVSRIALFSIPSMNASSFAPVPVSSIV